MPNKIGWSREDHDKEAEMLGRAELIRYAEEMSRKAELRMYELLTALDNNKLTPKAMRLQLDQIADDIVEIRCGIQDGAGMGRASDVPEVG